jgi:phage protein D
VVESVRHTFTLFSPLGVPLRATVALTLREFTPLHEQLKQLNLTSPDRICAPGTGGRSHARTAFATRAGSTRVSCCRFRRSAIGASEMSFVDLAAVSADPAYRAFWVPYFEVKVIDAAIPETAIRDITQITYQDDVKGIDSVELTVSNWDPFLQRHSYIGSETAADLNGGKPLDARLVMFEPGRRQMQVRLGYAGEQRLVTTVSVTGLEPSFTSGGPPTLTVRGLNVLHRFRSRQKTDAWFKRRPSEIAETFRLQEGGETIRVESVPGAKEKEDPIDFVAQDNQHDIDFLLSPARRCGYDLVVVEATARQGRHPLFGPSDLARKPADYRLGWGRSLVEFRPQLTTSNQIRQVTVRGWDRRSKRPITATVGLDDRDVRAVNPDLHRLVSQAAGREEMVVDEPVFTQAEARRRAQAILRNRLKQMVTATGTTVGLPDLRAGSRLEISGVGARLNGMYFVTETTHTLGDSGYTTGLSARREDGGGKG